MPPSSTEHRFLASTAASYVSQLGRMAVNFGMRMILARLVLPEGHGLFELAFRIVLIASAVRDLGLPYHLIRDERRPYGTVLFATSALGLLVTLALIIGAPLAHVLEPQLPSVLRVLSLWILIDGVAVIPRTYFERELRIDRTVVPEILRALAAALLSIPLAYSGLGVWSLVAGELAAASCYAVLMWRRAWGGLPLRVEIGLIPELLRKSYVLFLIWILIILVTHVDVYIIGLFRDAASVGYYARAYFIVFLVQTIVAPRALTAALVEHVGDRPRFLRTFRLALSLLLTCQVIAGYFLFFNAGRVVAILLGPAWLPTVPLVRILAFVPFIDPFTKLGGEVLKALNQDRLWLTAMALNLLSLVAFGLWLTPGGGARGMAIANYLMAGSVLMAWSIARICGPVFRELLRDVAWVYLLPLSPFLVAAWVAAPDTWARFAASILAAAISAAGLAWRFRQPVREFLSSRGSSAPAPLADAK